MRRLLAVPATLLVVGTAVAQGSPRQRAEALVQAARVSVRAGDTDQALLQLKAARKADAKYATAHLEYGQLLSATSTMGFKDLLKRRDAVQSLQDAIELDHDNPWPYLELGRLRLKMPLMRIAAENLFKDALDAAVKKGVPEAVADITYEIGQIYDRRYRTDANRHMMIGDVKILDPLVAEHDPRYIDQFLKNSAIKLDGSGELNAAQAENWYRQALTAQPGHENAAIAFAALLYETKRFGEMAGIAHTAATINPASARLRLAEGLAQLRLRHLNEASTTLEQGVKLMTDRERSMVAALGPIIRPPDARAYETLDAASRAAYDRAYWELADPLYLTSVNEQRLAFLGRVAYADLMFSTPDLKIRGALTDRGQIVLRYGEPPVIATFQPDVQQKNELETMGRITTLWYYPEPKLKFIFTGPPGMSTATFAGEFYGYADELRYSMPVRYDSLPGGLTTDSMAVQVSRFRGNQPQNTRVEVHATVPTNKLAAKSGASPAMVETGFMILDNARGRILDERDTSKVSPDETRGRVRAFERQFRPGEYYYRVEALEPASMASARASGSLSILSFPVGSLSLSDVLIGTDLVNPGEQRRRDELNMRVIPESALEPGQSMGLYWETYGARPSADGSIHLRTEISMTVLEIDRPPVLHLRAIGAIADAVGLSALGDKKVTVGYDRTVPAPTGADDRILNSINLQIESLPAGQYLLEVKMTDKESGQTAKTTHAVRIRRPQ